MHYFFASYLARLIQENTNADIFRLEAKKAYPLNHDILVELAKKEQESQQRPELLATVENIDQYDVIFLAYPNWWADMPMILYTFLENTDLSNKTIIPVVTHGGSSFSDTINTIAKLQPKANVHKNGYSISRSSVDKCEKEVQTWLKSLNIL